MKEETLNLLVGFGGVFIISALIFWFGFVAGQMMGIRQEHRRMSELAISKGVGEYHLMPDLSVEFRFKDLGKVEE